MSRLEALVRKCGHLCFCFVTLQYTIIVRDKQTASQFKLQFIELKDAVCE